MGAACAFSPSPAADRSRAREVLAETQAVAKDSKAGQVIQFDGEERRMVDWMIAAQAGDRTAYDKLLRVSIPHVRIAARKQGVPEHLVDDVVQEALLAVHRNRQRYDSDRPFTAWLRTIAQRRAIDIMRSQGRNALREVHEPLAIENHADPSGNPEDAAEHVDRTDILGTVVATLPARQREAVEQLALQGKSVVEAAATTGQTPGALAVNLHRALNALRVRFNSTNRSDNRNSSLGRRPVRSVATVAAAGLQMPHTAL